MEIKKVGVIGTGVMGHGIVQLCAMIGYDTIVCGRSDASLDRAINWIKTALEKNVAKGKMSDSDKESVLSRIKTTKVEADLADCDVIIESIIEDLKIKQDLFGRLDEICPNAAILATDTAGLPVTKIAEASKNPERVVGIHLLSPVVQSRALELIRPSYCTEEIFNTAKAFCESFGKQVILANDTPGFIVNRLLTPFVLDAVRLLEEGVATKEDIDLAMKTGTGHPVGPIELLDLAGLDNYCNLADNLHGALKDKKLIVPDSMRQLVKEGHFGRKTGKGFYDWNRK
ncbi:MAG: 3-hydroxyacyl-CoA dehydrogenase family protein [Deltaproteobacteria bacterium]|nr:3-hydroxyacyl-CoA dehydrogenase family protein [Deltaproteobacteria bacterium]